MNVGIIAPANTNPYACALLAKLVAQGNKPCCVICAGPPRVRRLIDYYGVHGFGSTLRRVLQEWRLAGPAGPDTRSYLEACLEAEKITGWDRTLSELCHEFAIDCVKVPGANAGCTVRHVRVRNVDLLLNTGAEILRRDIIQSPSIGILNAHMGPLPALRGMNVLEWSLLEGRSVGVTLHFIDEGVDTGDVLLFREIPVTPGDTLDSLRSKGVAVGMALMAEGVRLLERRSVQRQRQSPSAGRQYFAMHPRLRALAERRLRQRCPQSAG